MTDIYTFVYGEAIQGDGCSQLYKNDHPIRTFENDDYSEGYRQALQDLGEEAYILYLDQDEDVEDWEEISNWFESHRINKTILGTILAEAPKYNLKIIQRKS